MARVRFEGVTKKFGGETAINDLTLDIPDQEFLVLVGPSGCGKSTFLRLLAGLEDVDEGRIFIGDRLVNDIPPRDRDVSMVFQSYALYPHMTVRENMAFGLRVRKTPEGEIDRRVKEAARMLDIEELLRRRPRQLSGGQRQRVALGRAVVREPAAFLLDEPLSNLDARLRVQTRAELITLHRRLGTTFVYVTHDQVEAMTMAGRIAVMDRGVLQQVGPPRELYERPANRFVAGFIGSPSMNFVEIEARVGEGGVWLEREGLRLPAPPPQVADIESWLGKKMILGIRPEDIHLPGYLPPGREGSPVKARIELTELTGSELYLTVLCEKERIHARIVDPGDLRPGDGIELLFDTARMHLFDPATGLAIREQE